MNHPPFNSQSQAGQDAFAFALIGPAKLGQLSPTFLDIGMNDPIAKNNTFALEQQGWRGMHIDNDEHCCKNLFPHSGRKGKLVQCDATALSPREWSELFATFLLPSPISYLSLDIDLASLDVLKRLPLDSHKFGIVTIEHDFYRFGSEPRAEQRRILQRAGYLLICADVYDSPGFEFEDWWIHPDVVDFDKAAPFVSAGKCYKEILGLP